ncbi:MAG: isoleucine--tRNA ligase, partial [Nocardiopsaceae bacterium]|nr:isoleucine--tRNA ligase [Nocardiopsaceae bacterium]
LIRDYRISPYCPRCGTPLSDHEIRQPDVYREVTDPSVIARLRVVSAPDGASRHLAGADLLVWTTTPWTLIANAAVAVNPTTKYIIARKTGDGDRVVIAESLYARVLGEGWHVLDTMTGSELLGTRYLRPFGIQGLEGLGPVVAGAFVTTDEGTGLVHIAPAFGADDLATGRAHGLPVRNPVRPDGRFDDDVPLVGGMFFSDASAPVIDDLAERGLLLASRPHTHSYPHCWRCGTALLYYALPSWYITTTAIRERLLAENEKTNWRPAGVKHGRYGEWLRGNVDWALSRTRYWGTPLPLWECPSAHVTCVGSLAELGSLSGRDLAGLDPHRPYVDAVSFPCPCCGALATRVPEVMDVWFDSGSMPFAQWGAPLRGDGSFAYPAQFICEAIDQTRGWFYSLMAVGTLVFGRSAYENVVCLGLVLDDAGRKMSKHLGNVIEPLGLMDRFGADAVRWFFAASGSPWADRRIGPDALAEITRKVLVTWWNTVSFLVSRAGPPSLIRPGPPSPAAPGAAGRPSLDRWLLSQTHACLRDVTAALDAFDTTTAGRRLAGLIDDVSNWYVRRSRRRLRPAVFDPTDFDAADRASAVATLRAALAALTQMMAPFTPFLADYLWRVLRPGEDSVHLSAWPSWSPSLIDPDLSERMALVRRLVELGRSARAAAGIRTRQPLARALVAAPDFSSLPSALLDLLAEELNVRSVSALEPTGLVTYAVKPAFRSLGRRFGPATPEVASAISAADPSSLARAVADDGRALVDVPSLGTVPVTADDVIVTRTPRAGWEVATGGGETVALDLAMTPALRSEGLAREAIRLIADARKNAGLSLTDRIAVRWSASGPPVAEALRSHAEPIAAEVLATEFREEDDPGGGWHAGGDETLGLRFWLAPA